MINNGAEAVRHNGEYGNKAVDFQKVTFEADAVGTYQVIRVAAGNRVDNIKAVRDALGASTTIAIGYQPVGGANVPAYFAAAASSASAGLIANAAFKSIKFDVDTYITVTLAGAAATGDLEIVLDREYIG